MEKIFVDFLAQFPFTTWKGKFYHQKVNIWVASQIAEQPKT